MTKSKPWSKNKNKNYETERDEKDLILGNNFSKTNDRKEQLEYIFKEKGRR
jgi:hypothetical protein